MAYYFNQLRDYAQDTFYTQNTKNMVSEFNAPLFVETDSDTSNRTDMNSQNYKEVQKNGVKSSVLRDFGERITMGTLISALNYANSVNREAKEKLIQYIDQHYKFTKEGCLITNSDMGVGYSAYVFREIAKVFNIRHEHFWDKYHLYKEIELLLLRSEEEELITLLKESIQLHKKKSSIAVLETIESLIEDENYLNQIQSFKRKLIKNFYYTKEPHLRGIEESCIGIIESQHCKITNRMKNRKMYWSLNGAETMAKMIIDSNSDELWTLFMGDWRKEYRKTQEKYLAASRYLKNFKQNSTIQNAKYFPATQWLKS